ncbi:sensory box histidine kinase/response regulator [Plesiocystis pacifica SIR-1]|uniref:histidine kinase n=1 Tax=Plesiocystis pacifica SIR-1 TaxID=391625 RepID=A6FYL6_9BACT|nr:hybrid sensor histidine kinase/response regulator [Plesiocystis pacifica]EDM81288.1 sensory box histidine kinase/response regulator [Plesiocystis pacifica SIR-1]
MERKLAWLVATWLFAAVGMIASSLVFGQPIGMFAAVPMMATAWVLGLRASVVAAVASLPFSFLCGALGGLAPLAVLAIDPFFIPGHVLAGAVTILLGYSSTLRQRLQAETKMRVESERARVEAEMQAQLGRADRLATVGTLAAGVAHEVNNPLTFVLGNLELTRDELADQGEAPPSAAAWAQLRASMDESLREALEGAEHIRDVVGELKLFVRDQDDTFEAVKLEEVLDTSLKLCRHELGHDIELVRHVELVPRVRGNPGKLAQIFINLLVNAAQAMAEGKGRIELRLVRDGDAVVASVSDDGAGMSEAVRAKIFEPFFTTKPIGIGTGLGLPVCASIVRHHGGSLSVDSVEGVGTTFRLRLPVWTGAQESSGMVSLGVGARLKILVVDDDAGVRQTLARLLDSHHECTTVTNAGAAMAHLERSAVDLVVCDLMMPRCTGMELHDRLQAERPELLERLWFMTGGATTERARAFVEAHQGRVLAKPLTRSSLLPALREAAARACLETSSELAS